MITLVMIVCDPRELIEKAINSTKSIKEIDEVVIVNQGNEDLSDLCDLQVKVSKKGYADPDREYAYTLPIRNEWILTLDADEELPIETAEKIPELVNDTLDIIWFKFRNTCNGVDLESILHDDPHPRLFRKGSITWPQEGHTYPHCNSGRQLFSDFYINHHRTREQIEKSHSIRHSIMGEQARIAEVNFLNSLDQLLRFTEGSMSKSNGSNSS